MIPTGSIKAQSPTDAKFQSFVGQKEDCRPAEDNSLENNNIPQNKAAPEKLDRVKVFNTVTDVLAVLFLCSLIAACVFEVMAIPIAIFVGLFCFTVPFIEMVNFNLRHSHLYA